MFFYRSLFASLCFIFFGLALAFQEFVLYLLALFCGCLCITAKKKCWADPVWAVLLVEDFEAFLRRKGKERRRK